ncbi:hypothetical protein [Occallatibacter savannae]|uniref:hypothetical protein n=1 Tax=Occallatibacter savannae TaxID=1002691 RepID=UPI000D69B689|nr:hypothetical protein [Occallatibacter savannae]
MHARTSIACLARIVATSALVSAIGLFALVQAQMWILRYRAQQLMADMHGIHLHQSTWADAQRLMDRWGAEAHYDGTCSKTECRYEIVLRDASYKSFNWLVRHGGYRVYTLFGGRATVINAQFLVQNDKILRTSFSLMTSVVDHFGADSDGYALIVSIKSRGSLRRPAVANSERVWVKTSNFWTIRTSKKAAPADVKSAWP